MKLKICLMGLLCLNFLAKAQSNNKYSPLKDGDKLPYIKLNNVVNWPATEINLADYKSKVIIFDFWATWCSGCLAHFPVADSLQKEFKDKMQIILVDTKDTRDVRDKILRTIARFSHPGNKFSLPSAILDTTLNKLFWHQVLPHYVWVDQQGIVRATTAAEMLTRENVQKFISTGTIPKYQKHDFDHLRPIYTSEDLPINRMKHFSMFIKGKTDGNGGGGPRIINDTTRGIILHDMYLSNMYATLIYDKYRINMYDRYILETKNPSFFDYDHSDHKQTALEWERENIFSYELVVPFEDLKNVNDYALQDLNRYSPYVASVEKRDVKCWVLESDGDFEKFKSKEDAWANNLETNGHPTLQNGHLSDISEFIRRQTNNTTVLDKTNYNGLVDFNLSGDLKDMNNLAEQLEKYGIKLSQKVENIDMIIFRDRSN
jgi:thiol-disulfide isomerase/thioredoxin